MPRNIPGQPYKPEDGDTQRTSRPVQQSTLGIGPENFESVFVRHNHDGSIASGANLYGPYFIRDSTGKSWKLVVSTLGALSAVAV